MRFKVGDKVRVREWEDMQSEFGLDCCGNIDCAGIFMQNMKKYCGHVLTIKSVDVLSYLMEDDGGRQYWTDDMLIPLKFTKADLKDGMMCEMRDGERMLWLYGEMKGVSTVCNCIKNDLKHKFIEECDIVKVGYPEENTTIEEMLKLPFKTVIWERKKEITYEEALKVLKKYYGCDVKIKEAKNESIVD